MAKRSPSSSSEAASSALPVPAAGGGVREWIRDRFAFEDLAYLAQKKRVPVHRHTIYYYLGGMALFLFMVQVATGILLILYYRPSSTEAFESVQFIMADVPFGWLIRSIHSWGANLFVGVVMFHAISVFFLKAYRAPREMTWITGALLLFLALGFGFSGYLLPWNTLAYFATKVGTDVPAQVPLIGHMLSRILRGGSDVTGATLSRFYGIHVAILPAITTALLGAHLILVQRQGMSVPRGVESEGKPRTMSFVPDFLMRDMVGWLAAVGILAALAAFWPWELGVKADPFAPAPAGIRPEWFFLWMFQGLKYLPATVLGIPGETLGILMLGGIGAVFLAMPIIDRRLSRAWNVAAVVLLIGMAVLTVLALVPVKAPA